MRSSRINRSFMDASHETSACLAIRKTRMLQLEQVLDRGLCHAGGAVWIGVGDGDLSRVLRAGHSEEEYGLMKENHVR